MNCYFPKVRKEIGWFPEMLSLSRTCDGHLPLFLISRAVVASVVAMPRGTQDALPVGRGGKCHIMEHQDIGTKIQQQHTTIKAEIDTITALLSKSVPDEDFPNWRLELLWALRDFSNDLHKHFDLEEEGGFLSGVLAVAPHQRPVVYKLETEHETISTQLGQAIGALKGISLSTRQQLTPIREKVEDLFTLLRQHEAAEGEFLLTVYAQDEGGRG